MTGKIDMPAVRVAIVAVPVGLLSPVLAMQDSLLIANYCGYRFGATGGGFHTTVVSAEPNQVVSFSGMGLNGVSTLPAPGEVDVVIVPAGPPPIIDQPSIAAWLTRNAALCAWLRDVHQAGALVGSACTGSLLLAGAGLLEGLRATTHWAIELPVQQQFPNVRWCLDEAVIEHERLVTAGGGTTHAALVLHITKQYMGADVAQETARMMVTDSRHERQAGYRQGSLDVTNNDLRIKGLQRFLTQNFRRALSLEDIAEAVGVTERTLIRTCQRELNMTPMQYLQRIRIEAVMTALQLTPAPINQIVWDTGYEDVSSFQRLFKRHIGLTMTEYRRRFGVKMHAYNHYNDNNYNNNHDEATLEA